MYTRVTVL